MDWQPIETAPKDMGKLVLIFRRVESRRASPWVIAIWAGHFWRQYGGGSAIRRPTHWMPLDKPQKTGV